MWTVNYMKLDKILDINKWQVLQDSLAQVTKLAIITVDHRGTPITRHSDARPFCKHVRDNEKLKEYCQRCDSRAGLEAVRTNSPYIYLCHCKIVDVAIPIDVDDKYMGAVMAGQVRLPDGERDAALEQILVSPATDFFSSNEVRAMYEAIPTLSYEEIARAARMLHDLCHYIVEEAVSKNLILNAYERVTPQKTAGRAPDFFKTEIEDITDAHTKAPTGGRIICKNEMLKPAFDHIFNSKGETVSQKKLAALCNISAGHFSRLFVKETGETFPVFLARLKIEWSKQFLEKTELSITQISDELGFSEPGYYIKTFKKYESITPSAYRRQYNTGANSS